jgi:hypothetical protein
MTGDKLNLAKRTLDRTHPTTVGGRIGPVLAGAGDTLPSDEGRKLDKREWALAKLAEIGDFQIDGIVWVLSCSNEQTNCTSVATRYSRSKVGGRRRSIRTVCRYCDWRVNHLYRGNEPMGRK